MKKLIAVSALGLMALASCQKNAPANTAPATPPPAEEKVINIEPKPGEVINIEPKPGETVELGDGAPEEGEKTE